MTPHDAKLYEAAWLHFHCRRSQKEVADQLQVDKATVSRWLRQARERNIVSVSVLPKGLLELELRLRQTFRLTRTRVIPALPVPDNAGQHAATQTATMLQHEQLGKAAAAFLGPMLQGGTGVGLGGGRALAAFAHHLYEHCPTVGLEFYALAVSSREPFAQCATSLTAMCTALVTSEFQRRVTEAPPPKPRQAPAVNGNALRLPERGADFAAMAKAAEDYYQSAMQQIGLVVTSIGSIDTCWVLDAHERDTLAREQGAVGDVLYDIYGEGGTPIQVKPTAAVFPFTIKRLRQMVTSGAEVLVISSGKAVATYHALACRGEPFVTGIVTDEQTAREVLEFAEAAGR